MPSAPRFPPPGTELGPAAHVLYQDFTAPVGISTATLTFQMFVGDPNNTGFAVASDANPNRLLDYTANNANQFGRVDLLNGGTNAFSTASADVVRNFYFNVDQNMGNPSPWVQYTFDVKANLVAGKTYRLRFGDVSNINPILMGVDNVSLNYTAAALPEVGSAWLLLAAIPLLRRRRK